jgi:hypothetical protein
MEFMNYKERFDKVWVGTIVGILGALLGFVLFGYFGAEWNNVSFYKFIHDVFLDTTFLQFQDKVVTISILLDVVIFFLFMRAEWYNLSRGILAIVILAVPIALYFY